MSAATFRISLSAPEFSMLEKNALAVSCRYRDRHCLLGSTDAILEIFSRSKAGLLSDVTIREELSRIIQERNCAIELYRRQKKEKQTSVLRGEADSPAEKLFTEFYGRRKAHVQQQTLLGSRIEQIMEDLHEQGPGLERILRKKKSFLGRQSLPMYVSVSLCKSGELALSMPPMTDMTEHVARPMVEMESELSSLVRVRSNLRDQLLEAIDLFLPDSDQALSAFQKIVIKNRDLDAVESAINALTERLRAIEL